MVREMLSSISASQVEKSAKFRNQKVVVVEREREMSTPGFISEELAVSFGVQFSELDTS